jgi:hypothetical protein
VLEKVGVTRLAADNPAEVRVPGMAGIEEIADELYGLPPDEFTAARTRHEKAAKASGNKDEAARIHALAKPSVTAWLANQLVRAHRSELQPLLELGGALREATQNLDGDQLRELSRQQQKAMYALVQQARSLARAAGRSMSEDAARALEDTLRAALADEQAARLLLAGHLTDALHSSDFDSGFGFGSGGSTDAKVIPISRETSGSSLTQAHERPPRDEQRQRAEYALVEAGRALADATVARDDAQARATEADQAAVSARSRVDKLRQELDAASEAVSGADLHRRELASELARAERVVRGAERRRAEAQEHRDQIAKDD